MEIGPIIALLSGACFAGNQVLVRKGTSQTREVYTAVLIGLCIGVLLFTLILFFTAEWDKIWSISWQGLILLSVGGIAHFVAGRLMTFSCIRLIGANKANVIARTSLLYAVTFGVIFLHEPVTSYLVGGVLFITVGTMLVSLKKENETTKVQGKGVLVGLTGAFFWGISGVLIKPAIIEIGSPMAAAFISHVAALVIIAGFLFSKGKREQLIQLSRVSLVPLLIAGMSVSIAQLLRYVALSYSPVSVVTPILGTSGFFVLILSFLLNRNIEVFTWRVIVGMVVTVAGTFLLVQ